MRLDEVDVDEVEEEIDGELVKTNRKGVLMIVIIVVEEVVEEEKEESEDGLLTLTRSRQEQELLSTCLQYHVSKSWSIRV